MNLLWQNRSSSHKKDSFWRSVTSGKKVKNTSQEKPNHYNPFNKLIQIGFARSDKFIKQNEKKTQVKKKIKKQRQQSPKRKHLLQNLKPAKTFIGSKLQKKLQNYMLFLTFVNSIFRVSYHRINKPKYTVYVGKGNNSKLVKRIFRIRHWWTITNDPKNPQINLVWTQWSKNSVFSKLNKIIRDRHINSQKVQIIKQNKKQSSIQNQYNILLSKQKRQFSIETQHDLKLFVKKNKSIQNFKIEISHNHIQGHQEITDKKNLFHSIENYCPIKTVNHFNIIPLTFHISGQRNQYIQIYKKQKQISETNEKLMWIVKPGQKTNRGNGISVFKKVIEIQQYIQKQKNIDKHPNRTYIIQKYIFPALFHRRKFDIRCFILMIGNPQIHAFFYSQGYIRTSSKQFKQKKCDDKLIHLTNDAIQKKGTDYGKFQKGNKVSFDEYQSYLDLFQKKKDVNFRQAIFPKLKLFAAQSISAASQSLNKEKHQYTFQILGYDFMLDEQYRPWLIEVNTNPCLETGCPLLDNLIPNMLNNAFKIGIDPVFKPPKISNWPLQSVFTFPDQIFQQNKFEHIYSEKVE